MHASYAIVFIAQLLAINVSALHQCSSPLGEGHFGLKTAGSTDSTLEGEDVTVRNDPDTSFQIQLFGDDEFYGRLEDKSVIREWEGETQRLGLRERPESDGGGRSLQYFTIDPNDEEANKEMYPDVFFPEVEIRCDDDNNKFLYFKGQYGNGYWFNLCYDQNNNCIINFGASIDSSNLRCTNQAKLQITYSVSQY